MRVVTFSLLLVLLGTGGCATVHRFSFEEGMEGWEIRGLDLDAPSVIWSIARSQEMATDGATSLQFYLENMNDKGKIWIERPFEVEPDSSYLVRVSYTFASADWGSVNHWRIITGVTTEPPRTAGEIVTLDREDTGNGSETDGGYRWLEKGYDFTVRSDVEGRLYVVIGIWGVWETVRTYYVDRVSVVLMRLP